MRCAYCHKVIKVIKVHIRDECPGCGRDLHTCFNCEFYDRDAYRQCRESIKEPVQDKERANFCDFFRATDKAAVKADRESDARKKLDDLFK